MQFIRYSTKIKTSRRVIAVAHLVTKVTKLCKVLIASRKVGAGSVHCTLCNRAVKETSNSAWRRQGASYASYEKTLYLANEEFQHGK